MSEKRMLIVDAGVIARIDENRGDMGRSDFISFLIDSCLKQGSEEPAAKKQEYITMEEFNYSQQGMRELLRSFLEFFIAYGLEMGKLPEDKTFEELTHKLQSLGSSAGKATKV
ncbi:MAG: hypothetical protein Q8P00_06560 [Dehalococcoidia bacterium]|nr:hypothetical protein [Dehalococcoidia bacterium]